MKVLVDSSVWIDFFRQGGDGTLDRLIDEYLVVTNDVILTELLPSLKILNQQEVIDSLLSFERVPMQIDWTLIQYYQFINLQNGINKVGIPDLLILQQTIESNLSLYTLDKHFKLMQNHFEFALLT